MTLESELIELGFEDYGSYYHIQIDGDCFDVNKQFQFVSDDGYTYPNELKSISEVKLLIKLLIGVEL